MVVKNVGTVLVTLLYSILPREVVTTYLMTISMLVAVVDGMVEMIGVRNVDRVK